MDIVKEWSKGENGPDVDHVPLLLSNAVPKVSNLVLIGDSSNYENLFPCSINQSCYNSL